MARGEINALSVGAAPPRDVLASNLEPENIRDLSQNLQPSEWRRDMSLSLIYVLGSLFYILCISVGSPPEDSITRIIVNYSHPSLPILAVGIAVFPPRLIWLAFVVSVSCFVVAELVFIGHDSTPGWTAIGMVGSLVVTLTSGMIGGLIVRFLMKRYPKGSFGYYPEKMSLIGGIVFVLAAVFLGSICLWFIFNASYGFHMIAKFQFLMSQRIVRLALFGAGAMLLFFSLPLRRGATLEVVLHALLFAFLGAFEVWGVYFIPSIDAAILSLVLIFTRPVHTAVAGILLGTPIYVLMMGAYLNLPLDFTQQELNDDVIANSLYLIAFLIATLRVKSYRVEQNQLLTLGRRMRAQEFARFGYFLFDASLHRIYFDAFCCQILNVSPDMELGEFLRRVHPQDRDIISYRAMTQSNRGEVTSFRLYDSEDWKDESPFKSFSAHFLYETRDDNVTLIYGIIVDVTAEQDKEDQLRRILAKLSEQQGRQTQIFSMVSHELRTPAASISMLVDELDSGKEWKELGPQMRAVTNQLLSILDDMRQAVRPEQNLPIRSENLYPADVVKSVRDAFRQMAKTRDVEINLILSKEAYSLQNVDRVRLFQSLSNLVKNALLHAQATEIVIRYEEEEGPVGIWTVSDNGRNIPKAQKKSIFQPFVRGGEDGAHADGSGLGLYIVKQAVELLGGSIRYIECPTSGAEFRISLPLSVEQGSEERVAASAAVENFDLSKLSFVLFEDGETIGELLSSVLLEDAEAVKWFRDASPDMDWNSICKADVVISDMHMPSLSGDVLIMKLRDHGFSGPVIGVTAADIEEDVSRFRVAGADDVLIKPFRLADLKKCLEPLLKPDQPDCSEKKKKH